MVVGPFVEVAVILGLLSGGTLLNRDTDTTFSAKSTENDARWSSPHARSPAPRARSPYDSDTEVGRTDETATGLLTLGEHRQSSSSLSSTTVFDIDDATNDPTMHQRTLRFWKWQCRVWSPNTEVFQGRLLSRVLRKFPFLVEAWYWALIYWVYQLGRAFTVMFIIDGSVVDAARHHALQLVHLEQRLHIFVEVPIQQFFMSSPTAMHLINRIYSFIHIPGTILFLIVLYYVTTTRPLRQLHAVQNASSPISHRQWMAARYSYDPALYEKRRRTMATCNLLAFIIFTAWPCMPPRLLSDASLANGSEEGLHYGFVDTVHSATGESSVWTTNKFCNQYAAMPSLHFGYSFLIGLTIATMPLAPPTKHNSKRCPSLKRVLLVLAGLSYPATILTAIIATANHFVLDAVAGAIVCGVSWHVNDALLNMLPLEDYFLWALRIHKPCKAPLNDEYKYLQ
ncbi:hypothetical protein SCUCBS95973_002380 [Sporothrix curviconia]|uniref:Inositolphosphotransferase Aur1/Ipt1 domain-containing protein n=1 Tax=Sporothrix curviconia TaxID=1260050 RepID=A0ABP0B6K0_9PEZI